ncbi:hypothetical protein AB0A69_27545 [Streptomyces sp. NPDC045431]|uniref:hypothetical protein n=1 Tax=Streptomyces sp. NPDC045431 TaxID=3155613 RepID=UPI0033F9EAFD
MGYEPLHEGLVLNITGGDHCTFNIVIVVADVEADRAGSVRADGNEPATAIPQPWWDRTAVVWSAIAAVAEIASVIV